MIKKITGLACASALMTASPALAADFGGNCCADLEERIAELEATVAKKGNRKVSLTVYGQVNAGILWTDDSIDGIDTDSPAVVDNQVSESRFGFKGKARVNKDWSAGYRIEIGLDQKRDVDDLDDFETVDGDLVIEAADSYALKVRHAYWWLQSEQLGRVSVGQTSQATDGIDTVSVVNLGGAVKMLSIEPVGSSYIFGADLPFDGSRTNVVRYDSPTVAGFFVSASWSSGTDEDYDVALRYAGEFGEFKVAAGIGYRDQSMIDLGPIEAEIDSKVLLGSGSLVHTPSGIFVNGMVAQLDVGDGVDVDVLAWHVLGGVEARLGPIGKTTLFGEYAQVDAESGDESITPKWYGLGIVQAVDAAALDLYVTYRQYDLDVDEDGIGDPKVVMTGARIKF